MGYTEDSPFFQAKIAKKVWLNELKDPLITNQKQLGIDPNFS